MTLVSFMAGRFGESLLVCVFWLYFSLIFYFSKMGFLKFINKRILREKLPVDVCIGYSKSVVHICSLVYYSLVFASLNTSD